MAPSRRNQHHVAKCSTHFVTFHSLFHVKQSVTRENTWQPQSDDELSLQKSRSTSDRDEHDAVCSASQLSKSDTRYTAKRRDTLNGSDYPQAENHDGCTRRGRWGQEKYNEAWSVWTILLEKPRAPSIRCSILSRSSSRRTGFTRGRFRYI